MIYARLYTDNGEFITGPPLNDRPSMDDDMAGILCIDETTGEARVTYNTTINYFKFTYPDG